MDKISVVGLTLGIAALIMGQVIEGGHIASLLQPTAFLIVIGGTLGAVMLQSPLKVFREGIRMTRWVFVPPPSSHAALIRQATSWSQIARKEGLLALEAQIPRINDPFTRKGLQLLVDGVEPQRLREVLEVEIDAWAAQMRQGARIWEAAGGYARRRGARILEGYPVDTRKGRWADPFVYTGTVSAFRRAGFREVARRSSTRPLMRRPL